MKSTEKYTAYTFLGTGMIIIHDQTTSDMMSAAGYKIHKLFGRNVGFSLFTHSL